MKRLTGSLLAGVATIATLLGGCGKPPRTNVVVISMDTTRADRLGPYGYEPAKTPSIDALAAAGFVFRQHLTPVPITLPSHTSLFTGLEPPEHTVRDNGTFTVPDEVVTLAEVLEGEGYDTAAFVGSFPLAEQFNLDQGFAYYDDEIRALDEPGAGNRSRLEIYFDERPAVEVVDAAIAHHRQRTDEKPFFTFLHFFDPHQPQIPPPPYDFEFRQQPYDGEIAYVDEQIGRYLAELEARGERENTLVVLTADHGEGLGEHGEATHSILLHQATLHIPLIVQGPGVPHGETTAWTKSTQVFETVLELLGVEAPRAAKPRAASLVALMRNGGTPPAGWPRFDAYFETLAPRTTQGWAQLTGFMREDWRLVHAPRPELYELSSDPHETNNRFADEPQIATGLFGELARHLRDTEAKSVAESMTLADEETVKRLAALGYLQASAEGLGELDDMLDIEGLLDPKDRVVDISLFSEAKAALSNHQWELAFSLHQELLRRSPRHALAHAGLARLYLQIGELEKGLASLDRALALTPDDHKLKVFRGEILIELGRYQDGLDELLALESPEGSVDACTWIGSAYQRLGHAEEAKAWYRKGLELAPQNRFLRLYLANQVASEGDLEVAEGMFRDLVADEPYFALAYYNYGKLLLDRGDEEAARGVLERAAGLNPDHAMTEAALAALRPRSDAGENADPAAGEIAPAAARGSLLATWDGGALRATDLDAYLLSLPLPERRPAAGEDRGAWLASRLDRLFEIMVLSAPDRLEALEDDEAFRQGWRLRARSALATAHAERAVAELSPITREEARAYFDENRERMVQPERRAVHNILVAFPADADQAARDAVCRRAEDLRAAIVGGASFEQTAIEHSDSASAPAGGLIGLVRRDQLRGEVAELVFGLEPGRVSEVLRNRAGCQLFWIASIVPPIEPRFESVEGQVVEALVNQRRVARIRSAGEEAAAALGVDLPTTLPEDTDLSAAEEELFRVGDEVVLARDLGGLVTQGVAPAAALDQRARELVMAEVARRQDPDWAAKLEARAHRAFAAQYLRRQEVGRFVDALPVEELRAHYESNRARFVSDPKVELERFAWPIGEGDPIAALERPDRFVASLRQPGAQLDALWPAFADDPGVVRESVPLTSLRVLVKARPMFAAPLADAFEEGDVLGPFRAGPSVHVLRVTALVPSRPLSFLEARDQVRASYLEREAAALDRSWREELGRRHGLEVSAEALEAYGATLVERLTAGGAAMR